MSLQKAPDPRGRVRRGTDHLLERDDALAAIDGLLATAGAGAGSAVLLEAHAGMGKTRLHEVGLDRAPEAGLRVFRAAGAELEGNLAFGVAGQLLRSVLSGLPHAERAALLATAPPPLLALAGAGEAPARLPRPGQDLTVAHGLFSILASVCERAPALLAVDDLHWSDDASLQLLLYVLHRVSELPLAILLGRRPHVGESGSETLHHICAHPRVAIVPLAPLSETAVGALVRGQLGERADAALLEVCTEVTGGNPFYVHELLSALAEMPEPNPEQLARRARRLVPAAVIRSLRVRIGRLGPSAASLARAVAILGDDVPLRQAGALAGLNLAEAAIAADMLAQVEVLLAREPMRFVHPLVRHAIEQDVPAAARATRHLEAARLLDEDGADPEKVAAHILLGRAEGDPWAVEQLRAAARIALARSAPVSAVGYLQRAAEEPPAPDERPEVTAELGLAEAAAGLPSAVERLEQAIALAASPRRRAELALALGRTLYAGSRHAQAAAAFQTGLDALGPDASETDALDLHDELQTGWVAAASIVPALHSASAARSALLLGRTAEGPRSHGQRLLLAQAAVHAALGGEPAPAVGRLAERAWDEGQLLRDEGPAGIGWSLVTGALCLSGELERCLEVSDAVLSAARADALPLAYATACYVRGQPLFWQGQVTAAIAELEQARDARRYGWRQFSRIAAGMYAQCLIETGQLGRAEVALTEDDELTEPYDLEDISRLYVLGRLRLAQGRSEEALAHALDVGRAEQQAGVGTLAYAPWREVAAEACLQLGQGDRAHALAAEAHELAERSGALHVRIVALRLLGIATPGARGLVHLRAACALGANGPARLETIRALVELGAALRRANQRAAAREPLQRAADLARQGGARVLFERARTELAASGARPRRELLLSGAGSLTPSERRIADLAAGGQSNREIAQTLFVTPKTVEYHLRNVYRKLGIESRQHLARALEVLRPGLPRGGGETELGGDLGVEGLDRARALNQGQGVRRGAPRVVHGGIVLDGPHLGEDPAEGRHQLGRLGLVPAGGVQSGQVALHLGELAGQRPERGRHLGVGLAGRRLQFGAEVVADLTELRPFGGEARLERWARAAAGGEQRGGEQQQGQGVAHGREQ
jgi:DNA-binding CsgD family transcriptional regulator